MSEQIIELVNKYNEMGLNLVRVEVNGKKPIEQAGTVDEDKEFDKELIKSVRKHVKKNGNYSIYMGKEYIGIDIDLKEHKPSTQNKDPITKEESIKRWEDLKLEMPEEMMQTLIQQTTSGGFHLIFKQTEYSRNHAQLCTNKQNIHGYIDLRAGNGYLVGAGSKIDGKEYRIYNDAEVIEIPNELVDKLMEYLSPAKDKKTKKRITVKPVEGNNENNEYSDKVILEVKKLLNINFDIKIEVTDNGYKIESVNGECMVSGAETVHKDKGHSCVYINTELPSQKHCLGRCGKLPIKDKSIPKNIIRTILNGGGENVKKVEYHEYLDEEYVLSLETYDEQRDYLNQYIAMIKNLAIYIVHNKKGEYIGHKKQSLMDAYEEIKDVLKEYIKDPKKAKYQRIDFIPDLKKCPKDVFNTFKGYEIVHNYVNYDKKKQNELMKPIMDHLRMFMNNDEASLKYYLNWNANIFQNPLNRTGIAICFRSRQGAGKNFTCGEIFGKMIGEDHCLSSANPETFFGKHTEALTGQLLVVPNEFQGKTGFENADKLKELITDPYTIVNPKGLKAFRQNLYCNFVFATNYMDGLCLKIEEDERRFWVKDVGTAKACDRKYFGELKASLTWEALSAFYDYLMNLDLKGYDWIKERPLTEEYKELQYAMVPTTIKFLVDTVENSLFEVRECINDNGNYETVYHSKNNENTLEASQFLERFTKWQKDNGYNDKSVNTTSFGRYMKKIPGITAIKGRKVTYKLEKDKIIKYLKEKKYME